MRGSPSCFWSRSFGIMETMLKKSVILTQVSFSTSNESKGAKMFLATLTLILIVSGSSRRIGHHRQQQQHRQHKHHRQHASLRTNGESDDHAMDVLLDALERGKDDEAKNSKDIERKFSHSCWGYCDQGHCDWSHKGCKCVCKTNFEGTYAPRRIDVSLTDFTKTNDRFYRPVLHENDRLWTGYGEMLSEREPQAS